MLCVTTIMCFTFVRLDMPVVPGFSRLAAFPVNSLPLEDAVRGLLVTVSAFTSGCLIADGAGRRLPLVPGFPLI